MAIEWRKFEHVPNGKKSPPKCSNVMKWNCERVAGWRLEWHAHTESAEEERRRAGCVIRDTTLAPAQLRECGLKKTFKIGQPKGAKSKKIFLKKSTNRTTEVSVCSFCAGAKRKKSGTNVERQQNGTKRTPRVRPLLCP